MNPRAPRLTRAGTVPVPWRSDLAGVLISRAEIRQGVRRLAAEIQKDFIGTDLVVVALLTGTVIFLADLLRHLSLPLRLDFVGVSSYRSGDRPGALVINRELQLNVAGREVLIVDDILDTGQTLARVSRMVSGLKPARVRICVLLEKKSRRRHSVRAHYVGFQVPNLFVVGYGLDFAERYRNLPFIGVLRPEIYRAQTAQPT